MATTTVRISRETRDRLKEFAKDDGATVTDAIDRLVVRERRRRMWEAANAACAALRADPEAWAEWQSEVALRDSTIADRLPDEPEGDW